MIYLAERKLLFVKPKKTAGTSVEIALSWNAGPQDIVTPILEEDEAVRERIGGQFPVNWAWIRAAERAHRDNYAAWKASGAFPRRAFGRGEGRLYGRLWARYFNHIAPGQIGWRAPRGFLAGAFMVTMCRHPYELVVSRAYHRAKGSDRPFEQFLDEEIARKPMDAPYLFAARRPDFVIRYEHLQDDLRSLEARFDLQLVDKLPFTKSTARKDRRPAHEILSAAQRSRCQAVYRRTFDAMGYDV